MRLSCQISRWHLTDNSNRGGCGDSALRSFRYQDSSLWGSHSSRDPPRTPPPAAPDSGDLPPRLPQLAALLPASSCWEHPGAACPSPASMWVSALSLGGLRHLGGKVSQNPLLSQPQCRTLGDAQPGSSGLECRAGSKGSRNPQTFVKHLLCAGMSVELQGHKTRGCCPPGDPILVTEPSNTFQ